MQQPRIVFVSGATGKQGGAVARAVLARGHKVIALTRYPTSDAAKELAASGAEIVTGNFGEPNSLKEALAQSDTVYAMGTPFGKSIEQEVRESIDLIETAHEAGVGHIIYGSAAGADQNSDVPHFDSKYRVERHLAGLRTEYTISAPTGFMDLFADRTNPMIFLEGLRRGELRMGLPGSRPVQYVAATDIGAFVAELVERRESVFGQRFQIAGDELTGKQTAAVLSRASGRAISYVGFEPDALRSHNPNFAKMFEWLNSVGYSVDRNALRQEFPKVRWHSLEEWARLQDWQVLLAPAA